MRDLGNLAPLREVMDWLEEQCDSIAAPPESVRLILEIRKKLADAIADAERANLDDGLSVHEFAKLTGENPKAIYKQIERGQREVIRRGRNVLIPLDKAS